MKKNKINSDKKKRELRSQSRKTILRKFHSKSQQGKYPLKYLSDNIIFRRYGLPLAVDLFNAIEDYQIEDQSKCQSCGRHSILISAEAFTTVIPVLIEFEEENKHWKIADISLFRSEDGDDENPVQVSLFDELQTPEAFVESLFKDFTPSQNCEYANNVTQEVEQVESYTEIIYSFLLGIRGLKIVETKAEDDYNCRIIIQGKDSSPESQVEIKLYRFINYWLIRDIVMPKDLPDGSKGQKRSIFGFEKDDAEGDNK